MTSQSFGFSPFFTKIFGLKKTEFVLFFSNRFVLLSLQNNCRVLWRLTSRRLMWRNCLLTKKTKTKGKTWWNRHFRFHSSYTSKVSSNCSSQVPDEWITTEIRNSGKSTILSRFLSIPRKQNLKKKIFVWSTFRVRRFFFTLNTLRTQCHREFLGIFSNTFPHWRFLEDIDQEMPEIRKKTHSKWWIEANPTDLIPLLNFWTKFEKKNSFLFDYFHHQTCFFEFCSLVQNIQF